VLPILDPCILFTTCCVMPMHCLSLLLCRCFSTVSLISRTLCIQSIKTSPSKPLSIDQSINVLHRRRHSVSISYIYYVVYIYFNYSLITILRSVSDSVQCSLIIIFNCLGYCHCGYCKWAKVLHGYDKFQPVL